MKNYMGKIKVWTSNIDVKGTASFAVLLLTLINQALSMQGKGPLPIDSDQLNYWVSTTLTGVASLIAYFGSHGIVKKDGDTSKPTDGGDKSDQASK
ncbi:hypothetical protein [Lactobacillus plantarum] [Lactiplantibacillus mudanjiangensis]|uniref:phage holin n=1 Tax=Lactiplantibacillus mudanjiangensis TaxID=1296538 RepID=UPI001013F5D9|nr:phage holin [Lactiplantibacillus mudanjiangensis]VDG32901.1 hypothetical protein [Lactobacillus plantarum] [Lactiplantibacillus mudanjiangensis]